MKKFIVALSFSMIIVACTNSGKEPSSQGADTTASSSADSIARVVDSMKKAQATEKATDTTKKDSIKK